jgi:hypothetical protein
MRFVLSMMLLSSVLACSSEKKPHLDANKKLEERIQQRTDVITLEQARELKAQKSLHIELTESSPLVLWNNKKSPYQVIQFKVKPKTRSLIVHSSYVRDGIEKRAIVPVIVLFQDGNQVVLKRSSVGDNPFCGDYHCLEAIYDLRKVPAGKYKAVVLAPILEGKDAEYNYNNVVGPKVHHTYFGNLDFQFSEK